MKKILTLLAIIASAILVNAQTPIASYSFTGNANDASSNVNNAIVNGATLTTDRFGNANNAYSFDGVSNFISIPHISAYNTTSYSISMWFKYNGPGTAGKSYWSLLGKNDGGTGYFSTYQIHILANNKLGGRIGGGSLAQNIDWSTNAIINNDWHQVTYVFDDTKDSIFVYQDGVESYRDYFPYSVFQNSDPITLGVWNPYQNFFNGSIDEVNIYSNPLSAAQVLQNYNNSIGLVAYYPFNGNANDAAGSLNGTVNGGATLTTDRFGNANSAYSFDGIDDFISTSNIAINQTDNWSMSAWVNATTGNGVPVIVQNGNDDGVSACGGYALGLRNGNVGGYLPCVIGLDGGAAVANTQWVFLAMVREAGITKFYINGVLSPTTFSNTPNSPTTAAGTLTIGSATGIRFFNGSIDEVKIYNTALNSTQIASEYNISSTPSPYYSSAFGNSVQMNGANDNIDLGTSFTQQVFTIEMWLKPGATQVQYADIIDNNHSGSFTNWVCQQDNTNTNTYGFGTMNTGVGFTLTANVWQHLALVKSATTIEAYVNGVLIQSTPYSGGAINYSGNFLRLGRWGGGGRNWNGSMDEVRIWNTARSQAEIAANMNTELSGTETDLVAYYDMNRNGQGTGLTVANECVTTGTALNGTTVGTTSTPVFSPAVAQQKPGSGNAISFDGVDDFIEIPNNSTLVVTNAITVETWIFPNTTTDQIIINNEEVWEIGIDNGMLKYALFTNSPWAWIDACPLPINKWSHIALTYNGSEVKVYLNGILVHSAAKTGNFNTANFNIRIAHRSNSIQPQFSGKLDEIKIWNTALSQAQIRDHMCHKITSGDALYNNLIAYYNFDESTGNAAFDGTANANNGTLLNAPTRVTSGAAIGNTSTHNYVTTGLPAANLSFNGEDNLAVAYTAGTYTGEAGTHIYSVNETPNTTNGITGVGTNNRYFGVFNANITSPTYTATYNYNGNPFVTIGNEIKLSLFKRTDNAALAWTSAAATLNTSSKILTATGQNTEYILGSVTCVNPAPTIAVSGAVTFCQGNNVILTSSAATGNLWSNGATTQNITVTTSGIFTVVNTDINGCTSDPSLPVTVTVNALPLLQNVTGGGDYCSIPGTGVPVGLSGSETGVTYQLEFNTINNTPIGLPINGTGLPLSFGNQTSVGIYTVTAQSGLCTATMSGNVSVSISNPSLWYLDFDGDGYGNAAHDTSTCTQPAGFAANHLDCNDSNANVHPGPSGFVCATASEGQTLTLTAPSGSVFTSINFASYGEPNGTCGNFTLGSCHAVNSKAIVESVALNHNTFSIGASNGVFGDPCVGTFKRLYVQAFYGAQEICNGIDDDCNGLIDDGIVNITYYADADGDGFGNSLIDSVTCVQPVGYVLDNTDCDDNNVNIHMPVQYFVDADHDGFGSTATQLVCATTPPFGFSLNNIDCDDNNVNIHTPVQYFVDADHDGFGSTATQLVCATTPPLGFSTNNTDCNDTNATINPGATETCNGIDDNCNGTIDEGVKITFYQDFDNDGFGNNAVSQLACTAPIGFVLNNTDCNDTNNAINPNAIEICNNNIDDNCNGTIDEGCNLPHTYYEDLDEDNFGNVNAFIVSLDTVPPLGYVTDSTDCDDLNDFIFPGQIEYCNGIDDDCDGLIDDADSNVQLLSTWYQDLDNDGYGNENVTIEQCDQPTGYVFIPGDCDDTNDNINPDAIDYCNQIDDNCDGIIDNGFNTPPTLSFLGTGAYTNSIVDRQVGNPTDVYKFRVLFTDAENDLHLGGYPKLLFDYEGDGIYTGSFDKQYVLQESDVNDVITSDGKVYFIDLSYFKPGLDYHLKVVAYDEAGCIDSLGPFNCLDILELPNAYLYASDITMSNYNPDPGDTVTINAQIHYTSLNSAFDTIAASGLIVHLLSENEVYKTFPDDTVFVLGNALGVASWQVIANDTGGWYPFRVYVDYPNQLVEANEFDNDAVRAYVVGKDALGGKIDITASASPASQYVAQGATVSICGHASYGNIPVILSNYNVAGAEVSVTLIETGIVYKGTTNSIGDFCVTFLTPVTVGVYHVSISITDFTLIGVCPNPPTFEMVLPVFTCVLDMALQGPVQLPNVIVQGDSINGYFVVRNSGCQDITIPTKYTYTAPGSTIPLINDTIHPLVSGAFQQFNTGSFTYNTPGNYVIEATADANNELVEINENNNYIQWPITVLPNIPDITPLNPFILDANRAKPGLQVFQCLTYPLKFIVSNIGGGSTGAFQSQIVITNLTTNTADTFNFTVPGMTRFSDFPFIINYDFTYLGYYKMDIYADIPLNNGAITPELSETNNFYLGQPFEVIECKPDLVVNCFYLTPKDPEIVGNVTANFLATNSGTLPVTQPFDVTCNVNSVTYTQTVSSQIPIGGSLPMTFTFPTPPIGGGFPMLITLDQNNSINEFDETNNTAGNPLCYDFFVTNHSCKDLEYWEVPHMVDSPVVFKIPYGTGSYLPTVVKMKFEVKGPGILDGHTFFDIGIHTQNTGDIINPCSVEKMCLDHFESNVPYFFPEPGEFYVRSTIDPQDLYPECNEFNNSIIDTLQITDLPDYQVLSQYINPSLLNPNTGQPVSINVTYENVGANDIGSNVVHQLQVDNTIIQDKPASSLIGAAVATTLFDSTWMSNIPGTHIMRSTIDPYNTIMEGNESNNTASRAIIVGDAPNLYWADFDAGLLNCSPLCQTTFTGKIVNDGDLQMHAELTFYYVDNGLEIPIQTTNIVVQPNDTIDVNYNWQALITNAKIIARIANASPDETLLTDNDTSDVISQSFLTLSTTKVSCPGGNNGTATANVSGGVAPYSFAWSNGSTNATIITSANTYTVTVTDASGYSETQSIAIVEKADNTAPSISNMPTNITVTDTDGSCDEVVTWLLPLISDNCNLASSTATHTPGDVFPLGNTLVTYSATDAGGLINTQSFTITVISNTIWYLDADSDGFGNPEITKYECTQPTGYVSNNTDCDDSNPNITTGPQVNAGNDTALCKFSGVQLNAVSNGSQYSWKPSTGLSSTSIANPIATPVQTTTYTVTVTAGSGCTSSDIVKVTVLGQSPLPVVVSPIGYCKNETSQPLTAIGTNLLWYTSQSGGTGTGTAPTPATNTVGSVKYYVTQSVNSCESERAEIEVITNAKPVINSTSVSCNNGIGAVTITTFTNVGRMEYSIDGINYQLSSQFTNVANGTYTAYLRDTLTQCVTTKSNVKVNCKTCNTITITGDTATCVGSTVAFTQSGGKQNGYWITNNGGTINISTGVFTANIPGVFSITYFDDVNFTCFGSTIITVNQAPLPPQVITPIIYCEDDIAQTLTAIGNNLIWYSDAIDSIGSSTAPVPLTDIPGTISYFVTQADNGCISTKAQLDVITNAKPAITNVQTSCSNGKGVIDVIATAPGNLEYSLDGVNYQTASHFDNLTDSTYSLYVKTDSGNCISQAGNIIINCGITGCNITINGAKKVCFGATENYTQTGGNANGRWSISGNGNSIDSITGVLTANNSGCRIITYTDLVTNCTAQLTIRIGKRLVHQLVTTIVTCNGGNDGTAAMIMKNVNMPYTFVWSNGATTSMAIGFAAGSQQVVIADTLGCEVLCKFAIKQNTCIFFKASVKNVSCPGSCDGSITSNVAGGVAPYTYLWSTGSTNKFIDNKCTGNYTLTITDSKGCTRSKTFKISEPAALHFSIVKTDESKPGMNDGSINLNTYGGIKPYTYLWSNGSTADQLQNLAAGNYNVTVTDANGCIKTKTVIIQSGAPRLGSISNATINIKPNPARDFLYITGIEKCTVRIYSDIGVLMSENILKDGIVPISNLSTGVYSIQLQNEEHLYTQKFVKQ